VIYLDTSVVLAHLFTEDRAPPERLWSERLVSSRLLIYETWVRINARGRTAALAADAQESFARISFLDLSPMVLARALDPFPVPLRTLDTLHLASVEFLRGLGQEVELASYDDRQREAARRLGIPLCAWA
jgi:predicted nucleic acid-binding protein